MIGVKEKAFVVHHNPSSGRYAYAADPTDAIASAEALLAAGEDTWVAGNFRRSLGVGDLLLFKFGGRKLQQEPGIYAAARVTRAPAQDERGIWKFAFAPEAELTRRLLREPIVNEALRRLVPRSFGASIQAIPSPNTAIASPPERAAAPTHSSPDPVPPGTPAHASPDPALTGAPTHPSPDPIPTGVPTHGLIIKKQWLDMILAGTKTWEIRGSATKRRGPIALIESGSGHVVGVCELLRVHEDITLGTLKKNAHRLSSVPTKLPYPKTCAWELGMARRLPKPIPYRHPSGAVIWVELERSVTRRLSMLGG